MDATRAALLAGAAFVAGAINSVAGGGTIVSFPAAVAAGLSSVVANASNAVALTPSALASAWAYRRELRAGMPELRLLLLPSMLGGLAGAGLLLVTPEKYFDASVPFLLLLATAMLFAQNLRKRPAKANALVEPAEAAEAESARRARESLSAAGAASIPAVRTVSTPGAGDAGSGAGGAAKSPVASDAGSGAGGAARSPVASDAGSGAGGAARSPVASDAGARTRSGAGDVVAGTVAAPPELTAGRGRATVSMFLVAIYGGYFGAGMGIMTLAVLGWLGARDMHRMNGMKTLIGVAVNGTAAIGFLLAGAVHPLVTTVMCVGGTLGGLAGALIARRVDQSKVRWLVVAIGLALTLVLAWQRYA